MTRTLAALALGLSLAAGPVLAFAFDVSTVTPGITFPEPAPQPVSQGIVSPTR